MAYLRIQMHKVETRCRHSTCNDSPGLYFQCAQICRGFLFRLFVCLFFGTPVPSPLPPFFFLLFKVSVRGKRWHVTPSVNSRKWCSYNGGVRGVPRARICMRGCSVARKTLKCPKVCQFQRGCNVVAKFWNLSKTPAACAFLPKALPRGRKNFLIRIPWAVYPRKHPHPPHHKKPSGDGALE